MKTTLILLASVLAILVLLLAVLIIYASIDERRQDRKVALEDRRNGFMCSIREKDYMDIGEVSVETSVPFPSDPRNVYLVPLHCCLNPSTRGILFYRLHDLGLNFVDIEAMRMLGDDDLSFWRPDLDPAVMRDLTGSFVLGRDDLCHLYVLRHDGERGFVMADLSGADPEETARRVGSYIAYAACGFSRPKTAYFLSQSPFRTPIRPVSLPGGRCDFIPNDDCDKMRFREGLVPRSLPSDADDAMLKELSLDHETKRILDETVRNLHVLMMSGVSLQMLGAMVGSSLGMSELLVTRQHRIILTGFGGREIVMPPLQKAVYLLFLNHPDGISFYDLPDHRNELMHIYSLLSGRSDLEGMRESVDSIVDRFSDSVSVHLARIRKAFISVMPPDIARNYYINGPQGREKAIALPRSYVLRDDLLGPSVAFDSPFARKGCEYRDLVQTSAFRSFMDLSFLLRPLGELSFREGYVPDAFWCGTHGNRHMRLYACRALSQVRWPDVADGVTPPPYDDSMYLQGVYTPFQAELVPPLTLYMSAGTPMGVWEAYLLTQTGFIAALPRSSDANARRLVFSHHDLAETAGVHAAQALRNSHDILPCVEEAPDGSFLVSCCVVTPTEVVCERVRVQADGQGLAFTVQDLRTLASL